MWLMLNICFLSWSLEFWYVPPRGCLDRVSNELWYMACHMCHGELSTGERSSGISHLVSSRLHLIADLALYPFPIINCSHEYDDMLSPVSPQESWDLEVGSGSPIQISYSFSPLFCELYWFWKLILNSWNKPHLVIYPLYIYISSHIYQIWLLIRCWGFCLY